MVKDKDQVKIDLLFKEASKFNKAPEKEITSTIKPDKKKPSDFE